LRIPQIVETALASLAYRRSNAEKVKSALADLETTVPGMFVTFYEQFQGPFGGRALGFAMADLCELKENVVALSKACRETYNWPKRYVVLSELFGGAVLVLDGDTDSVFVVDFEGGDEQLSAGTLPPRWNSFEQFLQAFFAD